MNFPEGYWLIGAVIALLIGFGVCVWAYGDDPEFWRQFEMGVAIGMVGGKR